jgi:hypothetical protein
LRGRDRRGLIDLAVIGAGLADEGGAAGQPPPGLLQKALLDRAGLPDIRFHDLRHSCARC